MCQNMSTSKFQPSLHNLILVHEMARTSDHAIPVIPRSRKVGGNGPVIIPYKGINLLFTTLYGIITGPLSA